MQKSAEKLVFMKVPEGKDEWIDNNEDWTAGCISLKNEHIREIFASVQTGTQIEIVQ